MTKFQAFVFCACLALPAVTEAQSSSRPLFGGPTTTPSGSYLNLAPRPRAARPLVPAARATPPPTAVARRPRVVCGMTLLPGDPAVDPGMTARVTPPAARPGIRAVEPSICGAPATR